MKNKIKNIFLFASNFIKHPTKNASVVPSSVFASRAMLLGIDFSNIHTILELGPGTGIFTEEILKKCKPGTKVILVEIEKSYIGPLQEKFGDKVTVVCDSAHRLDDILKKEGIEKVDLIVSGLPFPPEEIREIFFDSLKKHVGTGTIFRFFTYMPPVIKKIYKDFELKEIAFVPKNFPPLWVYEIQKQ